MSSIEPAPRPGWQHRVFARPQDAGRDMFEERRSPGGRFVLIGIALLLASQTIRWGWGTDAFGKTRDVGYMGQSAAGFAGTAIAIVLLLVVRARSGASSGFRIIQLLPLVLGLACLVVAVSGFEQAFTEMSSYRADERPADLDYGAWLAVLGGVFAFLGGLFATGSRIRNPTHADAPLLTLGALMRDVAVGLLGIPIWLVLWVLAGGTGGPAVGTVGALLGPVTSLAVWHWMRGGRQDREHSGSRIETVPMDRLREVRPRR